MCQRPIWLPNSAYMVYMPNIWQAYVGAVMRYVHKYSVLYDMVQTHSHTYTLIRDSDWYRVTSAQKKKLQLNSHAIAIYVPATNIPLKCHMSKLFDVHWWEKHANIYMLHKTCCHQWRGQKRCTHMTDKINDDATMRLHTLPVAKG